MIKADITKEESILHNLDTWCYEVGDRFEKMGRQAAEDFLKYISNDGFIIELGAGDGASVKVFQENKRFVVAVDINKEKLDKIPSPVIAMEMDMLESVQRLKTGKTDNIFTHHALEHCVEADEVIKEVGRVLAPGGFFYAVVPAQDVLHSVHHVVFESPDELLPPGCKPIKMEVQLRDEMELICVAQKLA